MDWKQEWKPLASIVAIFAAVYWLPVDWLRASDRVENALWESLHLAKWYAQEHVLLCLVPAFFIAGAVGVFVSQAAVMKYLGPKASKPLAYGVAADTGPKDGLSPEASDRYGPGRGRPAADLGIGICKDLHRGGRDLLDPEDLVENRKPHRENPRSPRHARPSDRTTSSTAKGGLAPMRLPSGDGSVRATRAIEACARTTTSFRSARPARADLTRSS